MRIQTIQRMQNNFAQRNPTQCSNQQREGKCTTDDDQITLVIILRILQSFLPDLVSKGTEVAQIPIKISGQVAQLIFQQGVIFRAIIRFQSL